MTFLVPALHDLADAAKRFHLWISLGNMDIRHRYKRSILGPFWITINIGAIIFGIGTIYSNLFNSVHSSYIPYLAVSIILWNFIAATINEGSESFITNSSIIKNVLVSKHIHLFHCIWRNLIIFAHNILILIPVFIFYKVSITWVAALSLFGLLLILVFLLSSSLFLAIISARYRDVPPAIGGLLQLTFFATPIIWESSTLRAHRWIVDYNPFYHLIECVRAPLLYGTIPALSFSVVAGLTIIIAVLALGTYAKTQQKIVFWL